MADRAWDDFLDGKVVVLEARITGQDGKKA